MTAVGRLTSSVFAKGGSGWPSMGGSINGGTQDGWFIVEKPTKMDIWGYPYFTKPSYISSYVHVLHCADAAESVFANVSLGQFSRWMQWTWNSPSLLAPLVAVGWARSQEEFALFYRKFFEAPGAAGFVAWTQGQLLKGPAMTVWRDMSGGGGFGSDTVDGRNPAAPWMVKTL